ncbi:MAG: MEMO1 family protein [Methanomicrobia archaeon]|nr:MEMO1 family protein [Methanomicrobia archaeon]
MIRRSRVAGSFYPHNPDILKNEIEKFFEKKPEIKKYDGKIGVLCPHAGYIFSGKTKSYSYRALAENFPETFIIIGPNHTGMGSPLALMRDGEWETPLGNVKIDSQLAEDILKECDILDFDETSHLYEHSIEVQLPFLQYLSMNIKFVPICMAMQDIETAGELGESIKKVIKNRSIGIIASSDLMHYGYTYGYMPFRENILENMKKMDMEVLNAIVDLDPERIYDIVKTGYTMCGYGCVSTMIFALKDYVKKGEILHYSTSYEVSHDISTVVGYGSVVLR